MRRAVRRECCIRFVAAAALALTAPWFAPSVLRATPIVFRVFNLGETTAYVVKRNSNTIDTEATSQHGVFSERIEAARGDRIVLSPNVDLAPPPPPRFDSVLARGPLCATLSWTASGDPTVVGYIVSYGVFSVDRSQVLEYQYWVETGPINTFDVCALSATTYFFAVQSVNNVGQVSAYSEERTIEMTTTAVLISRFDARASIDAVRLSWDVEADEAITGFRIYRRAPGSTERLLLDAPLPSTATSYVDKDVRTATTYSYTLAALSGDGTEYRSAPVTAITPSFAFALDRNAPNPFHENTRIPFTLDRAAHITVRVYNVTGALVATLFDGTLAEGRHEVGWGGHDLAGNRVAAGTYFCTLTADKVMRSQKMVLVR